MKIAIAFFGIPRGSATTMPAIAKHFIEPARLMGECKVFYHLYQQDRVVNVRSGENAAMPADAYLPFEAFEGELETPGECLNTWQFDRIQQNGDHYKDDFRSMRNLVHQLHSLRQVTLRLAQWQPDVVLFLRPDLFYHSGFSAEAIRAVATRGTRSVIPQWHWWGGYNDRFAMCGANVFQAYGRRIEQALPFSKETGRPLHAERLVRFALTHANASVRTTTLQANRVRIDGELKPENFNAMATTGSIRRRAELFRLGLLSHLPG